MVKVKSICKQKCYMVLRLLFEQDESGDMDTQYVGEVYMDGKKAFEYGRDKFYGVLSKIGHQSDITLKIDTEEDFLSNGYAQFGLMLSGVMSYTISISETEIQ